jgi:hypothetical protein
VTGGRGDVEEKNDAETEDRGRKTENRERQKVLLGSEKLTISPDIYRKGSI